MRTKDVTGSVCIFHCAGSPLNRLWVLIRNAAIRIPTTRAIATITRINPSSAATENKTIPAKKTTSGTDKAIRTCFKVGRTAGRGLVPELVSWIWGILFFTNFLIVSDICLIYPRSHYHLTTIIIIIIKIIVNNPIVNGHKAYFLWLFLIIATVLIINDITKRGRIRRNVRPTRIRDNELGDAEPHGPV